MPEFDDISLRSSMTFRTADALEGDSPAEAAEAVGPDVTAEPDREPLEVLKSIDDLDELDVWLPEFESEYGEIDGDIHEVCDGMYWNKGGPDTDTDLGGGIMPDYQDVAASQRRSGPRWPQ